MTSTYTNTQKASAPCGCNGHGVASHECCDLVCFERPRYFCGHLLTDGDLSLQQTYLVEKNRLHNRTLHGHGIVCGLRLTCDPDCCGHVVIGNGYAIDPCGNDLVVCSPYSFNAIHQLKKKHLIPTAEPRPCDHDKDDDDCHLRQCFYITACYVEQEAEYTTPFVAGCNSTPGACEATRVLEKVRFDIVEQLPKEWSFLDDFEEHILRCWKPFTDGHFGKLLGDQFQSTDNLQGTYTRFCQLRILFLEQLRRCPPKQNCTLEHRVRDLRCPKDDANDPQMSQQSFDSLIHLVHEYVYDCILSGLAFECPCPPKHGCVVLGTVEIEDGKIVQVCNCSRKYVWSFATLPQVVLATIFEGAACRESVKAATQSLDQIAKPQSKHCCPEFQTDTTRFGNLYELNPHSSVFTAQAFVQGFRSFTSAFQTSFNIFDPLLVPTQSFVGANIDAAQQAAKALGLGEITASQVSQAPVDLVSSLRATPLVQPGTNLLAFLDSQGHITSTLPYSASFTGTIGTDSGVKAETDTLKSLTEQVAALQTLHKELSAKVADLQRSTHKTSKGAAPPAPEEPKA